MKDKGSSPENVIKLSFEKELTFVPKINSHSRKIASESNRLSIIERPKVEKKLPENENLLLKSTFSNRSSKIVAKLKTSFFEHQNESSQEQLEILKQDKDAVYTSYFKPSTDFKKDKKNKVLPSSISQSIKAASKLYLTNDSCSKSDDTLLHISTQKKDSNTHDALMLYTSPSYDADSLHQTIHEENPTKHENTENCFFERAKRKKIETLDSNNKFDNTFLGRTRSRKGHNRSLTFPLTNSKQKTDMLDEQHQEMLKAKRIAGQAITKNKVFLCNGPYQNIRHALRRRGWIEKNFKADPIVKSKLNKKEVTKDHATTDSNMVLCNKKKGNNFSCDNQYGILSRVVRNSTPTFIWTLRRDDIDFRFLQKEQVVNHYLSAWSFTTKAGLCMNLHKVRYFENLNSLTFFPRCYRLCCDEERQSFVDDFRITAVQGILKLLVTRYNEWKLKEHEINKSKAELEKMSLPATTALCKTSILALNVLSLTLKACNMFLDKKEHKDIESDYIEEDRDMNAITWKSLVNYYYQIVRGEAIISNAWQHVNECKEILRKMDYYCPQLRIDGHRNLWILKPGAKSRGRGIEIKNMLDDIVNLTSDNVCKKENRWVIQKYIEQPFLVYRTKFDIRQWFLVTDWNPLILWFYQDCYIRFCSQEFTMDKFDAKFHLSNNSVQKHFKNGERSELLPESNMWSSDTFKKYLFKKGYKTAWDDIVYPGMKEAVIASLQSCQDSLECRKNSFELYGADFMLSEDLHPWLIEINSSPALGASTPVTEKLCNNVIEDTLKVVLDKRENKKSDTGRFELAYKQQYIVVPNYMGCNLSVDGIAIQTPSVASPKTKVKPSLEPINLNDNCDAKINDDLARKSEPVKDNVRNLDKESSTENLHLSLSCHSLVSKESERSLSDVPIEKINKRHSNLAGLIEKLRAEENRKKNCENSVKAKIAPSHLITCKKSVVSFRENVNATSRSTRNSNIFEYDCSSENLQKDFLDNNIKKVQSKHNPTFKLKFKKPVKEIKTKVRYSKQFGMMNTDQRIADFSTESQPSKYDTSLAKRIPLTHG